MIVLRLSTVGTNDLELYSVKTGDFSADVAPHGVSPILYNIQYKTTLYNTRCGNLCSAVA